MKKIKTSLRFKAILIIILSVFAVTAAGIIAGTLSLSASINKTTGENYAKIASAMAYSVAEMINTRVELIKAGAGSEIVTFAVKAINSKYGQGEEAGKAYLMDMDKKWIEASPGHSLIKEYLDSNLSLKLRSMVGSDGKEAEILVTDRYGGLVASSRKTPDFYQGGKQWWQEAFDGGKGSVVIGDILFDEATKLWCVPFAVPVHDEEGRVIGIYRSLTDISLFSGPLEGFRIGNTGNAALIDDKGYLIYIIHPPGLLQINCANIRSWRGPLNTARNGSF